MIFELTFLGTNSALPAHGRYPSAQVLNIQDQLFLIDCGEGTQSRMVEYEIRQSKISQIFISHLHGDHVFGLIGLLTSLSLIGRKQKIDLFGPAGIKEIIEVQLRYSQTKLAYPLEFHITNTETFQLIFENNTVEVYSIPLIHRIPTNGFLFKEKERPLKIISEKIEEYGLSIPQIKAAKKGQDVLLDDDRLLPNHLLTKASYTPRSYAYCSDTLYTETIIPYIQHVDLLYHESTFLKENQQRAIETMHSTAADAAKIALKGEVGMLLLGHYSSRHRDVNVFEKEAQTLFANSVAGREGMRVQVPYLEEMAKPQVVQ